MTKLEKYLKDYSMLDIDSASQWGSDIERFVRKGYVPNWVLADWELLSQSQQQELFLKFKKETQE
jgi:hypothetical protein